MLNREAQAMMGGGSVVRIPPQSNVPITPRVRRILDSAAIRRLASISQLGVVSLVYPGATHSRHEHSLGVYHECLRWMARLSNEPKWNDGVNERWLDALTVASLVHDVGHWPFCHPIEDMDLPGLRRHEHRARSFLDSEELRFALEQDWRCDAADVEMLLNPKDASHESSDAAAVAMSASVLSGPIDIDKVDYLQRDSLHAGVPYGRHFDPDRLLSSLTVHPQKDRIAVGIKGRTAAEMMVFARYVMFSEVYWHSAVRSATAMLQRAVFLLQHRMDLQASLSMGDAEWIEMLVQSAAGSVAEPLVDGLFGARRRLFKRVAEFHAGDGQEVHRTLSRKPYWYLVAIAEDLSDRLSTTTGVVVHPADILIDAPPVKLEVDIDMDLVDADRQIVHRLADLSPVTGALADQQFDRVVKRVRVFVRPDLRESLASKVRFEDWHELLLRSCEHLEATMA